MSDTKLARQKPVRFKLKRETVRELSIEELGTVAGGDATASCCASCNTSGSTWCPSTCS